MPGISVPGESPGSRALRWVAIYLLAPAMLLVAVPSAVQTITAPDFGFHLRNLTVATVAANGPGDRAGVRRGDQVVSFAGRPLASATDFYRERSVRRDLAPVALTLQRGDERIAVTVTPERPSRQRLTFGLSLWVDGLAFLLIGWWVYAKRHDAVARTFFGLCLVFAFYLIDVPPSPNPRLTQGLELLRDVLQLLGPVFFLRFIQLFPATAAPQPLRGRQYLIYAPTAALVVLVLAARIAGVGESTPIATALSFAAMLYLVAYFAAGLVIFARKVLRRDRPVQHTKLRLILVGLVAGLVPFLLAMAASTFGVLVPLWNYLGFAVLLIPTSFALAIMRYGALDTAFVVRVSLIYGLLTAAILVAYFLAVGVLGNTITSVFAISNEPLAALAIAACSLLVLPLRGRLQRVIDRAFYPSRRADRQAIADLGRALADQTDAEAAHDLLLAGLDDLYRAGQIVLLRAEGDSPHALRCVRSLRGGAVAAELPASSPLAALLAELRRPRFREEIEDALPAALDPADRALLDAADPALAVPLVSSNRLYGVLLLGAKPDGSLYSQIDLANLTTLALQTAPLLHSLNLMHESLLRRQYETELAVAREIQAHLLPTASLDAPRLRVSGCMAPCRQVGGDYFDYFGLGDDRLGICIADVSGKGIPAALLMTTVRVAFRAEAQAGRPPEAVVMALNAHLRDVLSDAQFVSFFYGVVDAARDQLAYCNAGMDPPLLFHRDGRRDVLRKGGPVLGVMPEYPYRRGTVTLATGDLLLAYTDGITDQTEPVTGEFFDLERLEALARRGQDLSPDELCRRIFGAVEAFGGTEASDDKTVMVLKIDDLARQP